MIPGSMNTSISNLRIVPSELLWSTVDISTNIVLMMSLTCWWNIKISTTRHALRLKCYMVRLLLIRTWYVSSPPEVFRDKRDNFHRPYHATRRCLGNIVGMKHCCCVCDLSIRWKSSTTSVRVESSILEETKVPRSLNSDATETLHRYAASRADNALPLPLFVRSCTLGIRTVYMIPDTTRLRRHMSTVLLQQYQQPCCVRANRSVLLGDEPLRLGTKSTKNLSGSSQQRREHCSFFTLKGLEKKKSNRFWHFSRVWQGTKWRHKKWLLILNLLELQSVPFWGQTTWKLSG